MKNNIAILWSDQFLISLIDLLLVIDPMGEIYSKTSEGADLNWRLNYMWQIPGCEGQNNMTKKTSQLLTSLFFLQSLSDHPLF